MRFATLELRLLAWVLLAWVTLVLVVLSHGAPLPPVAFGVWRRVRRWRSQRARLGGPQAVSL